MLNSQDYLNKCDLLNKFHIGNLYHFPVLKKVSFECSNLLLKHKISIKQDFAKFYILLIFYVLTQKLPYLFLKKNKKVFNFKINYLDKKVLNLIESSFNFEKSIVIKKKATNLTLSRKKSGGLMKMSLHLVFRDFYLNSEIFNIFGELTPFQFENIRLTFYLKNCKTIFNCNDIFLQESLFYNFKFFWNYSNVNAL